MKNLILINGTMGVGKTAICEELRRLLPRNVFLDGDWCWLSNPFTVTDETKAMVRRNIVHLLNSFLACSEYENIIFCWVMHTQEILDDICGALNLAGCHVHKFTLTCSEQALRDRLSRDIALGLREPDVVQRAVARLRLYDDMHTVKIDVSSITARQAAEACAAAVQRMAPR